MALLEGTGFLDSQRPDPMALSAKPGTLPGTRLQIWVPEAVRGGDMATRLLFSILQAACHLPGPAIWTRPLKTLKAFKMQPPWAGLCLGLVLDASLPVIAGRMNAS